MPNVTSNNKYRFTILGSGTSSGVPTISCDCPTCMSDDPHDKRLRASLLVRTDTTTVVIDTTPDFRQQMLRYNIRKLDGIVYTHAHFDHIGGFDDIRAFNFTSRKEMPIYSTQTTLDKIKRTFYYAFEKPEQIGGGVPIITPHIIHDEPFNIGDIKFVPLVLYHGRMEVLGFRIGDFAYCTDTNFIPDETFEKLHDLDCLVIDALRFKKHSTHFNIEEALSAAAKIDARLTYFTHIAHQIKHSDCELSLPPGYHLAYDGLEIIAQEH